MDIWTHFGILGYRGEKKNSDLRTGRRAFIHVVCGCVDSALSRHLKSKQRPMNLPISVFSSILPYHTKLNYDRGI